MRSTRPHTAAHLAAACLTTFIGAVPAHASAQAATGAEQSNAAPTTATSLNIPAQPLDQALHSLGEQASVNVLFDPVHVRGREAPAIQGLSTVDEALARLLRGSGLTYRFIDAHTVTLIPKSADARTSASAMNQIAIRLAGNPGGGAAAPFASSAADTETTSRSTTSTESAGSDEGSKSDSVLQEVVVKSVRAEGTKGDAPLIEVPQSISILPRDLLEALNGQRMDQVVRYSAGTSALGTTNTRGDYIYIRGFPQSRIGSYLDNLRLSFNAGSYGDWNIEPYGMERIEILRGPSSVLYGQGSPGGLVNSVSKRPTATPQYEIAVTAGNFDRRQLGVDIGGPIDQDGRSLYRFVGVLRDSGTQIDQVGDDRLYIAPSFTQHFSENTSITFLSEYLEDRTGASIGFMPPEGMLLPNPNGPLRTDFFVGEKDFNAYNTDRYALGYLLEHKMGRWQFRQNTRYTHQTLDYKQLYGAGYRADLRTLDRGSILTDERAHSITTDNQLQTLMETGGVTHSVIFGADYQETSFDALRGFGSAPAIDAYAPVYGATVISPDIIIDETASTQQFGLYAQDQLKFADRWVVTMGIRQDWTSADHKDNFTGTKQDQDASAFTGRAGVVYLARSGLAPYLAYSTSFLPTAGQDAAGNAFKPETAEQIEAGVKYQPNGVRAMITLSLFDLRRQNLLTRDPDNINLQVQRGEVRSRGVELEGTLNPIEGLDILAAFTYLDQTITKSGYGDVGFRLGYIPKYTASIWSDYTLSGLGIEGLGVSAGIRYTGSTLNDTNDLEVPAATVFDAGLRYDWNRYRLALNLNNVTDKIYVNACDVRCYYAPRRTTMLTLRYRW